MEKSSGSSVIGSDGRHEIWRGDVDHDNEPKVSVCICNFHKKKLEANKYSSIDDDYKAIIYMLIFFTA